MPAVKNFDWLNNILKSHDDLMVDADAIKSYDPRLMNRWLAQNKDCVAVAALASKLNIVDKRMHYDFVRLAVRKRNRYTKWVKKSPEPKTSFVKVVMEYHNVGKVEAEELISLLTDDQLNELASRVDIGGRVK